MEAGGGSLEHERLPALCDPRLADLFGRDPDRKIVESIAAEVVTSFCRIRAAGRSTGSSSAMWRDGQRDRPLHAVAPSTAGLHVSW